MYICDNAGMVDFGDLSDMDGQASYSVAAWIILTSTVSAETYIFSKTTNTHGWVIRLDPATSNKLRLVHFNPSLGSGWDDAYGNTVISLDTLYSVIATYNSSNNAVTMFVNAVAETVTNTMAGLPGLNTSGVTAGGESAVGRYWRGRVGHCMFWDTILDAADAALYHAGTIPKQANLKFWCKGTALPGADEVGGGAGSISGTVTLFGSSPPDDYYVTELPQMPIEIAGQELHRSRLVLEDHHIAVPLKFLGRELVDDIDIVHSGGFEPTGKGFGIEESPARAACLTEVAVDPGSKTVQLSMWDLRRYLITLYDQFVAPDVISDKQIGVFRVYRPNVDRTVTCDSSVWVEQTDGSYIELAADKEPLTLKGLLVENEKESEFHNSAFKAGIDVDWSSVNEGTNGSSVDADTSDLMFKSSVSAQSCKVTAGDPLPASPVGHQQAITVSDSAVRTLSVFRKDDSGKASSIKVQRSSDSYYLKADGTWTATETYIDLPVSPTRNRYVFPNVIEPGVGGDTYTIGFYVRAAAGQVSHLYHAQLEKGRHASSPIVTDSGATYTRKPTVLKLTNNSGARIWNAAKGHLYLRALPLWSSGNFDTKKIFVYLEHDVDNYIEIYRDTGEFSARAQIGGSAYYSQIQSEITFSEEVELEIGLVWRAPGDLGADEHELQLFANFGSGWLEGTVAKPGGTIQEAAASFVQVGGRSTTTMADAYLKYFRLGQEPLWLEELKALP